ncbi:MAG: membrane integrity-associated transporter subunit PqiC [Magnetococcales bacterium]|nr:membrane integrity-associated transporter subunit PqiC [Magnetococcales bacterium]
MAPTFSRASLLISALVAVLLTACSVVQNKVEIQYFVLNPAVDSLLEGVDYEKTKALAVELGPVEIPNYLNRPHVVTRQGESSLHFQDNYQWAGYLRENISRVLSRNLAQNLGISQVRILPGTRLPDADYRIEVDIETFEPDATGAVYLSVQWWVFELDDDVPSISKTTHLRSEALEVVSYPNMVNAMSHTLGLFSQELARGLVALEMEIPRQAIP